MRNIITNSSIANGNRCRAKATVMIREGNTHPATWQANFGEQQGDPGRGMCLSDSDRMVVLDEWEHGVSLSPSYRLDSLFQPPFLISPFSTIS